MTTWTDSEVLWLNVTNAALGLVVLAAVLALAVAVGYEVLQKARQRAFDDPHVHAVPGLGTTLADGGEKTQEAPQNEPKK